VSPNVKKQLELLAEDINQLSGLAIPDEDMVDFMGQLRHQLRRLTAVKRMYDSEFDVDYYQGVEGEDYKVVRQGKNDRSYNTPKLLADFNALGVDLVQLIELDVVRPSWRWSDLQRAADHYGLDLTIAHGNAVDDSGAHDAHVGQVYKAGYDIVGKEVD
jgi:hypothetical protein